MLLFSQAEDGIRAAEVTGVQTCALLISWHASCALQRTRNAPLGQARHPALRHTMSARTTRFRGCARVLLGAAVLQAHPTLAQEPEGLPRIPRVSQPPPLALFLDGRHSHTSGTGTGYAGSGDTRLGARVTEFRQREPGDGTPVSQETTAYVSYDDENLYVAFVCRDDPAKVRASLARRQEMGGGEAAVGFVVASHRPPHP